LEIQPTAIVHPKASIASGVKVGAYSLIGENVRIGNDTVIESHVVVEGWSEIGQRCHLFPFVSIGAPPQHLRYRGEPTRVIIGDDNVIREFVTINRATAADIGVTIIGNNNLLMAYCHVAHNCKLGNNIVMANAANLAGHIHVEDYAIIGGLTGIHQFTRIGAHCIIGGASAVSKDVPPFVMASGNYAKLYGLNIIGLKRRGFKEEAIQALKKAYRIVFRSSLLLTMAIAKVKAEVDDIPEVRQFVEFIETRTARGITR